MEILLAYDVKAVVDVRSYPKSKLSHFSSGTLPGLLASNGVAYHFLGKELGGLRKGGYTAYIITDGFREGIRALEAIARETLSVIICAERFPWKCHRKWISLELQCTARWSAIASSWWPKRTNASSTSRCGKATGSRPAPSCCARRPGRCSPGSIRPAPALAQAERRLADAVQGPRQREIDEARAALAGAASALETERREYERIAALVERRLLSASELDQARARRDTALATHDQASARLRLLQEGTRPEQVREAEAAVAGARAALAELETSAVRYEVRAPRVGRILP